MALNFVCRKYSFDYDNGIEKKIWSIDIFQWGFTIQDGDSEAIQQKFDNELDCQNEAIRLMDEKRKEGYVEVHNDIKKPGKYNEYTDYMSQQATWYSLQAIIAIIRLVKNTMDLSDEEKRLLYFYLEHVKELYIELRHTEIAIKVRGDSKLKAIMDCRILLNDEKIIIDYLTNNTSIYIEKDFTGPFKESFAEFLKTYGKDKWIDEELAEKATIERQEKDAERRKKLIPLYEKYLIKYPNRYRPNRIEDALIQLYGGTKRDPSPYREMLDNELILLLECVRDLPENKVGYETLLTNFYHILDDTRRSLSLKRVKALLHQVMVEGIIPDPRRVYLGDSDFESWETSILKIEEKMDPDKIEQVRPIVERIVHNIDEYFLTWRFGRVSIYLTQPDGAVGERGLFRAAGRHPELEPLIEQYVEKLMEAIEVYPLYEDYDGWRGYIGASAVAVLAAFNPSKHDDTLLTYLKIVKKVAGKDFDDVLSDMRGSWNKDNIPNLPKTFAKYPALQI